jgi:copper(I)-binding protein
MNKILFALGFAGAACAASAHVSLDPPRVEAGATYRGVLRIGHGCDNAPTTALEVQLPSAGTRVLDAKDAHEIPVEFAAPKQPGPVWLKVQQRCGSASVNWADIPAQGTSTEGMKTPALLLQVMTPAEAAAYRTQPKVEGAWIRASLPGQPTAAAYMRITAKQPGQLVAVTTPAAGKAEVHEMKMEGDVMRMRPAGPVDLAPGRPFDLKPGGYHVMLQELKAPLQAGSSVPLTLVFRNAQGVESRLDLRVPVAAQAPGAAGAGVQPEHKH